MIINRKSISVFLVSFLVIGLMFLALPEKGYSGIPMPPSGPVCCQLDGGCFDIAPPAPPGPPGPPMQACSEQNVVLGGICNESTDICEVTRDVPTLSEWGLIAMAGILGIIGFMVIRRKRATA